MKSELSVLIIDENRIRASMIEDGLKDAGCGTITIVSELTGLMREIESAQPDVIVMDIENTSRDRLEAYFAVSRSVQRPVAMFVDKSNPDWIEAAVDAGVSSYVVDGLRPDRVKPILDVAMSRFNAFRRMQAELEQARDALASRKVVDRAKGIVMRRNGLSEAEAYDLLRRTAMSQNRKIVDLAESLISAEALLGGGLLGGDTAGRGVAGSAGSGGGFDPEEDL
ncbi:MAG: ANTAR domain-containing protein [Pseudomonadota bacterium]